MIYDLRFARGSRAVECGAKTTAVHTLRADLAAPNYAKRLERGAFTAAFVTGDKTASE